MKTVLNAPASRSPLRGAGGVLGLGLAHRAHRLLARLAEMRSRISDAVEVVDLVLDHPRLEPLGLDLELLARARPGRARARCAGRSTSTCTPGQAETALLGRSPAPRSPTRAPG